MQRRVLAALLSLLFVQCTAVHLVRTAVRDRDEIEAPKPGTIDDASRMNAVAISEIVEVSPDDAIAIEQIRSALARARAAQAGVSIAGFRHSMGGHTSAPDGIVLNMLPHNRMEMLADGETLRVQSGAVWKDVIAYLDARSRSVAVMQSDNPFSVGGSLSVNVHGWQHLQGPIASTVLAMNVLRPDGAVVRCSRTENASLFSHILGGYGLFGVILDADLRTVPNERYRAKHTVCDIGAYERVFDENVRGRSSVGMAYGRISVAPDHFLREAIVTTYEKEAGPIPPIRKEKGLGFARLVFRGSAGSDYGKNLRWWLERKVGPLLDRGAVSRNQVLDHTIGWYMDRSSASTDILHEYFVPRGHLAPFLDSIRPLLRREHIDLLNVTIRDVAKDDTTALPYAREDVFAVVMFFNQKRTAEADAAMQELTRELIEKALASGGTYYLSYRLHATPEQLRRAYPQFEAFVREKKRVDPEEVFVNRWWLKYRP